MAPDRFYAPAAAPSTTIETVQVTDDHTLVASDARKRIEATKATAMTVTFPPDVFAAGDFGEVVQWGAGQVTATEGSGVSIRAEGDKTKTSAQYAGFTWTCVTPTEFHIQGSLAA